MYYCSCTAGEDFVQTSLIVNFAPNQESALAMIPLVDDVFAEVVEQFEVFIAASPGVFVDSPAFATVNVMDFDPPLPGVCVCVCLCIYIFVCVYVTIELKFFFELCNILYSCQC